MTSARGSTLASAAALLLGGCLSSGASGDDCYDGLELGAEVELALVERYGPSDAYEYAPLIDVDLPSCDGRDGLGLGRFAFRTAGRAVADEACQSYWVEPVAPLGDVDFTGDVRPTGGVIGAQVAHRGGFWRFWALRVGGASDDLDPFGEAIEPGAPPPLVVQRYITAEGEESCFDEWAAEIRRR